MVLLLPVYMAYLVFYLSHTHNRTSYSEVISVSEESSVTIPNPHSLGTDPKFINISRFLNDFKAPLVLLLGEICSTSPM